MEQKKFVSEEQDKKYRKRLIIILIVSFLVGLPLVIFGIINVINFDFIGIFLIFLGAIFSFLVPFGIGGLLLQRPLMAYSASASAPVINEGAEAFSPAIKAVSRSVMEGIDSLNNERKEVDPKNYGFCDNCGHKLDDDDVFCPVCGKKVR